MLVVLWISLLNCYSAAVSCAAAFATHVAKTSYFAAVWMLFQCCPNVFDAVSLLFDAEFPWISANVFVLSIVFPHSRCACIFAWFCFFHTSSAISAVCLWFWLISDFSFQWIPIDFQSLFKGCDGGLSTIFQFGAAAGCWRLLQAAALVLQTAAAAAAGCCCCRLLLLLLQAAAPAAILGTIPWGGCSHSAPSCMYTYVYSLWWRIRCS